MQFNYTLPLVHMNLDAATPGTVLFSFASLCAQAEHCTTCGQGFRNRGKDCYYLNTHLIMSENKRYRTFWMQKMQNKK